MSTLDVYKLSARERELISMLSQGHRLPECAVMMGVSPHTVRNHLKHAFRKLGVHSQNELLVKLTTPPVTEGNVGAVQACLEEMNHYLVEALAAARQGDYTEVAHGIGHVQDAIRRALGKPRGDGYKESYPHYIAPKGVFTLEAAERLMSAMEVTEPTAQELVELVNKELDAPARVAAERQAS